MRLKNIFDLKGLTELGSRDGVDMRPTLLRVLTDLYVHRLSHTSAEERQYTELALRLLESVDAATRIAVARRFARYPSPPPRILHWLARDLPDVAIELRSHPLLQPATAAGQKSAKLAAPAATVTHHAQPPAQAAPRISLAIAAELTDRFFAANAEERRLILRNLNVVAPSGMPYDEITRDASIVQRLETAALTGNSQDFARDIARVLRIPREQAQRIVRDDLGEPVLVVAKALGLPREVLYRVLMFLNPAVGHSVERVHALAILYDEMTATAAIGMISIWQSLLPREPVAAKHQPLFHDDEGRHRPRPRTGLQRMPGAAQSNRRRIAS